MSHSNRYTVIGNHLAQHERLSLVAIGLAAHIQSLPEGACVSIRTLAGRFPEGEIRIAGALRELEEYGYLERLRERLPNGQVVTRTISYNCPEARGLAAEEPEVSEAPAPARDPDPDPEPAPEPEPDPDPEPPKGGGAPAPVREAPAPAPVRQAAPPPQKPAPAPVPPPTGPAANLLRSLGADDPRLALSSREVHRLAPCVERLLAQGAAPEFVRSRLTNGLPAEVKYPAGLLASRLDGILPPQREPDRPAPPRPDPFQNCDRCERAFRSSEPGFCNPCRRETGQLVA